MNKKEHIDYCATCLSALEELIDQDANVVQISCSKCKEIKWRKYTNEKDFEYDGQQFKDVNCPHCGAQCSIYDPAQFIPFDPEEGEEEK